MDKKINVFVKIIPYETEKIIGWKGDILEIGLPEAASLKEFLIQTLHIPTHSMDISVKKGSVYEVTLYVKHTELIQMLLQ